MTKSKLHRRPVYKRGDGGQLVFVGWATPKQASAEIAGKFLPVMKGMWRRTVRVRDTLVVEYYTPSEEEQDAWARRPLGRLNEGEKARPSVQPAFAHGDAAQPRAHAGA